MVFQNGFSLGISTNSDHEKIKRGESNYVALANGAEYKIELSNNRSTDAMAEVFLEGEPIGTWFIPAHDRIIIERPADTPRKFTFFSEKDPRASQAGVIRGAETNGLVKVVFYPKKQYISTMPFRITGSEPLTRSPPFRSLNIPGSAMVASHRSVIAPQYQSGSTVLGQSSSQDFGTMRRFSDTEIDWPNQTTIIIRLVVQSQPISIRPGYISIAQRNEIPYPSNPFQTVPPNPHRINTIF